MKELSIAFQTDKTAADYIALAQLVNNYAFDAVSVYCDAPFHPSFGPLLLMAPHIKRARLGPAGVSLARMAPIDMAANIALLDNVASGGAYFGIVRGAWLGEHGIHEPPKPITAIREGIAIIKKLLAGESAGYGGEVYQIAEHVSAPYPLPKRDIPIMIGTWGPKLCEVAGHHANEVKVGGSANADLVPVMQRRINNHNVGVVIGAVSVVDDDRDAARALARREVALYLPVVAALDSTVTIEPERLSGIDAAVKRGNREAAAAYISDDLLERFAFAGNPADIIEQCERIFDAGARRIEFGTPHGIHAERGIRLLGEKVLPAFG